MNKKQDLTAEQKHILHKEGTEAPGSSSLNNEKREGSYYCVGCGTKLFDSKTKYESGSGWPSFFKSLPDVFETKTDHHLGYVTAENYSIIYTQMIENLEASVSGKPIRVLE